MPNTTNFTIPYPASTDFVKDGATAMGSIATRVDDVFMSYGQGRNRLINGDFRIAQRGTSFTGATTPANNDNIYTLDRWVLLSDGNDIADVTQATDVPTGGLYSIGLDVETANKKFGILQVIEQQNIVGVQNKECTLSFSARTTGSSLTNLKAVVLSWTGTADSVTRDVVSAWNNTGITPTWAASWTAENTPTNLNPSNTWTRYSITATCDTSNIKNVAIFIWNDDATTTIGDFLYITDVQFEVGSVATPFERRQLSTELMLCQRYFQALSSATTSLWAYNRYWNVGLSGGDQLVSYQWKTTMRVAPTVLTTAGSAIHSFAYASYNTGVVNYNLEVVGGVSTHGMSAMAYYASNNGGNNLAVGYTSGTNNNAIWVSAEL